MYITMRVLSIIPYTPRRYPPFQRFRHHRRIVSSRLASTDCSELDRPPSFKKRLTKVLNCRNQDQDCEHWPSTASRVAWNALLEICLIQSSPRTRICLHPCGVSCGIIGWTFGAVHVCRQLVILAKCHVEFLDPLIIVGPIKEVLLVEGPDKFCYGCRHGEWVLMV